jgi:hypothetical protein
VSVTKKKKVGEQIFDLTASELEGQTLRDAFEYNAYGTSTVFQVTVLTTPIPLLNRDINHVLVAGQDGTFASKTAGSFIFRGRIMNLKNRPSPHLFLADPFTFKGSQIDKRRLIASHTLFISPNGWQEAIPNVGDVVKVSLQPGDFSFNLQQAYFDSLTIISEGPPSDYKNVGNINKNGAPLGDTQIELDKTFEGSSDSNEFIKRMVDSNHFVGFSDSFLAGLAANASAESDFGKHITKGLGWPAGDKIKNSDGPDRRVRSINGYCSHGLWQLNVCGETFEGGLFASAMGIDIETFEGKEEFVEAVNNDNKLFSWMAMRMYQIPEIKKYINSTHSPNPEDFVDDSANAFNAGAAITQYFERPAGCGKGEPCKKKNKRGQLAAEMFNSYKVYLEKNNSG